MRLYKIELCNDTYKRHISALPETVGNTNTQHRIKQDFIESPAKLNQADHPIMGWDTKYLSGDSENRVTWYLMVTGNKHTHYGNWRTKEQIEGDAVLCEEGKSRDLLDNG